MKHPTKLLRKYSQWSLLGNYSFLVLFGVGAVCLLAHYLFPARISLFFVQRLGAGLFGLFGVVISLEAIRSEYFPRMGIYARIYKNEKPFQFWAAVFLYGLVWPAAWLAYSVSPLFT